MKKLLCLSVFALCLTAMVHGQSLNIGAKAGINFASLNGDDTDEIDGRTSFHIGAVAKIGIGESLAVQPEIIYSAQGFTGDAEGVDATGKLDYINIPILIGYEIAPNFSLQGGPQFGFNITDEADFDGITQSLEAETFDLSAVIGAQFETALGLFFQARYGIGFSDVIEDVDAKNANFSLSVGYFFL